MTAVGIILRSKHHVISKQHAIVSKAKETSSNQDTVQQHRRRFKQPACTEEEEVHKYGAALRSALTRAVEDPSYTAAAAVPHGTG